MGRNGVWKTACSAAWLSADFRQLFRPDTRQSFRPDTRQLFENGSDDDIGDRNLAFHGEVKPCQMRLLKRRTVNSLLVEKNLLLEIPLRVKRKQHFAAPAHGEGPLRMTVLLPIC